MLLLLKENDEIKMWFILWIKWKVLRMLDYEESGKIYLFGICWICCFVVLVLLGDFYIGLLDRFKFYGIVW